MLEGTLGQVWVEAEVTEVTRARSGHVYFKLTDHDQQGQVDAVMWKGQAMRYASRIDRGAKVLCRGRVTVYERGGRYQLVTDRIEEAGAGKKARQLAELKARLQEEGLFDEDKKRPLPGMPGCVGVVTSRSGAAIQDIRRVAYRRFPTRIVLAHASVQGDQAPAEIVAAVKRLESWGEADVLIVGRGGGSAEDLDCFNDEAVVRAIAECGVPVISAVGHEIDVTLADLAADRRAATPSEAAELAVPELEQLATRLVEQRNALASLIRGVTLSGRSALAGTNGRLRSRDPRTRLRMGSEALGKAREALARWPSSRMGSESARLVSMTERLRRWPALAVSRAKGDLMAAGEGLYRWPEPNMARRASRLGELAARLDVLSPLASLERGYSVVRRTDDGSLVRSPDDAPAGTRLRVTVARGELSATVDGSSRQLSLQTGGVLPPNTNEDVEE